MSTSPAVRRLCNELKRLSKSQNPQLIVRPSNTSLLEWHFVLHNLPNDTVYKNGQYHGKLLFPQQYPMAPPSLMLVTPNGRFATNQKLCLSMTDYHPESWDPSWSVESILVGFISFWVDTNEPPSAGAIHESASQRQRLASASLLFNRDDSLFCELFPDLVVGDLQEEEVMQTDSGTEEEDAGDGNGMSASRTESDSAGDEDVSDFYEVVDGAAGAASNESEDAANSGGPSLLQRMLSKMSLKGRRLLQQDGSQAPMRQPGPSAVDLLDIAYLSYQWNVALPGCELLADEDTEVAQREADSFVPEDPLLGQLASNSASTVASQSTLAETFIAMCPWVLFFGILVLVRPQRNCRPCGLEKHGRELDKPLCKRTQPAHVQSQECGT